MVGRLPLGLISRSLDRSLFDLSNALNICPAERGRYALSMQILKSISRRCLIPVQMEFLGGTGQTTPRSERLEERYRDPLLTDVGVSNASAKGESGLDLENCKWPITDQRRSVLRKEQSGRQKGTRNALPELQFGKS